MNKQKKKFFLLLTLSLIFAVNIVFNVSVKADIPSGYLGKDLTIGCYNNGSRVFEIDKSTGTISLWDLTSWTDASVPRKIWTINYAGNMGGDGSGRIFYSIRNAQMGTLFDDSSRGLVVTSNSNTARLDGYWFIDRNPNTGGYQLTNVATGRTVKSTSTGESSEVGTTYDNYSSGIKDWVFNLTSGENIPDDPENDPGDEPEPSGPHNDPTLSGKLAILHPTLDKSFATNITSGGVLDFTKTTGKTTQEFLLTLDVATSTYSLKSQSNGYYLLDVNDGLINLDGDTKGYIGFTDNQTDSDARWVMEKQNDGSYEISNLGTGRRLDMQGTSPGEGTVLQTWPDANTNDQRWGIESFLPSSNFDGQTLKLSSPQNQGQVLTLDNSDYGYFEDDEYHAYPVEIASDWQGVTQRWKFEREPGTLDQYWISNLAWNPRYPTYPDRHRYLSNFTDQSSNIISGWYGSSVPGPGSLLLGPDYDLKPNASMGLWVVHQIIQGEYEIGRYVGGEWRGLYYSSTNNGTDIFYNTTNTSKFTITQ